MLDTPPEMRFPAQRSNRVHTPSLAAAICGGTVLSTLIIYSNSLQAQGSQTPSPAAAGTAVTVRMIDAAAQATRQAAEDLAKQNKTQVVETGWRDAP